MPLFKKKKQEETEKATAEDKKDDKKEEEVKKEEEEESEEETDSEEESGEESEESEEDETEQTETVTRTVEKKVEKKVAIDTKSESMKKTEEEEEEEDDEESEEESENEEESPSQEEEVTTAVDATLASSAPTDTLAESTDFTPDLPADDEEDTRPVFEAIDDYDAEQDGDLGFAIGDRLYVMAQNEDGWWEAENEDGEQGMVPSTYLKEVKVSKSEPTSPSSIKSGKKLWGSLRSAMKETTTTDVLHILGAVPAGFRNGYLINKEATETVEAYLMPKLSPSNLFFSDLIYSPALGMVKARASQWCRIIQLQEFRNIPLPGTGTKVLKRFVRICLFDGTRIHSNILKLEAETIDKEEKTWAFNHKEMVQLQSSKLGDIFVRTNHTGKDVGILFELSVKFVRTSSNEESELVCGWALLPLCEEGGNPTPNRFIELNINGGTPEEKGVPLDANTARNEQTSMFRSLLNRNKEPRFGVKLVLPSKEQKELLDILPDVMIGSAAHITALARYRQILADQLLRDRMDIMSTELISDPFLATFPKAAQEPVYMDILRNAWIEAQKRLSRQQKKDQNVMKNTYIKCYMHKVYPRLSLTGEAKARDLRENSATPMKAPRFMDPVAMLLSPEVDHRPFSTNEVAFNVINPHCLKKVY